MRLDAINNIIDRSYLDGIWSVVSKLPFRNEVGYIGDVGDLHVYSVDGDEVKTKYCMDFVEAGNDARYTFIPSNQVWVDIEINIRDHPFIVYHEVIERTLMKRVGLSYDEAHNIANKYEKERRVEF
jgi:hypothetical protein